MMVLLLIEFNAYTVLIFTFVNIYTLVANKIYLDVPKDVHIFRTVILIALNGILSIDWVNKWAFKLVRFKEKKIYALEENVDSARVDIEIN